MLPTKKDLTIYKGATLDFVIRWEGASFVYREITGMPLRAPLRLTVPGHGLPDDWRVAISDIVGPDDLNAKHEPPRENEYHNAEVVDADTLEINSISAHAYKDYVTGGVIRYRSPKSLANCTARMQLRTAVNSATVLYAADTVGGQIVLNDVEKTITVSIPAADTDAFDFTSAVYDLEIVNGSVVTRLMQGSVTVVPNVTR